MQAEQQQQACEHSDVHWYLDPCKEAGWRCLNCGEELGYRPDLDRTQTECKVRDVLGELHDRALVYVSNATEGEIVCADVARACRNHELYDQYSIARLILEHPEMHHGSFWRGQARRWLAQDAAGLEHSFGSREQEGASGG